METVSHKRKGGEKTNRRVETLTEFDRDQKKGQQYICHLQPDGECIQHDHLLPCASVHPKSDTQHVIE